MDGRCSALSARATYESIEGMKNQHDLEPTPDETAGMVWWNSLTKIRSCGMAGAGRQRRSN
jgi:hypothetical protein